MNTVVVELLVSLLTAAHLFAMGIASAGPLFCVLLGWRGRDGDAVAERLGRRMCWASAACLLVGSLLGALATLLVDESLWNVLRKIPARAYWFALSELLVSLVLIVVHAVAWRRVIRVSWLAEFLALFSMTNLLYHFPPLMIVIGRLATGDLVAGSDTIDRAALLKLMYRPEVVAPWIHYVLAAFAAAAALHLLLDSLVEETSAEQAASPRSVRSGAIVALTVVVLQLPMGLWLLTVVPNHSRAALMGSSILASVAFLGSLIVVFLLLGRLLKIALGDFQRGDLRLSAAMILLVFLLMTISLQSSRQRRETKVGHAALGDMTHVVASGPRAV